LEKLKETDDERAGYHAFPPACLALLKTLSGNNRCIDCAGFEPEWASIRFGAMLCLQCSGRHRKLGVNISPVRSTTLDSWTLVEILSMLEGGNTQLKQFFHRHKLCENNNNSNNNNNNNNNNNSNNHILENLCAREENALSGGNNTNQSLKDVSRLVIDTMG